MDFGSSKTKTDIFLQTEAFIKNKGLHVISKDEERPWGGFLVIDEKDADKFITAFFPGFTKNDLTISGKLSPKILIVAPETRLSWQYHHRRAEIWKLIGGEAEVITSDTDEEKNKTELKENNIIELKQGERHRLVGKNKWGIVAEIWRHTDMQNPSNEADIVRVQDDFGR